MHLLEKVGMLYGESGGTPLRHEFHYELLWAKIMAPNHYHPLRGKTKG
jgi:hypothetical protein